MVDNPKKTTRLMREKIVKCSPEKLAKMFIFMVLRYVQIALGGETVSLRHL